MVVYPCKSSSNLQRRSYLVAAPRVIVVGVGTMGSAACAHLACRGAEVVGLERFAVGHTFGSHGGQSRAFRLAYYEHPDYVPLLKRSRELWMELNERSGREVFAPVGGVYLSAPGADFVRLSHEAALLHGLDVECLDAPAIRKRFPIFNIPDDWTALVEEAAGLIVPERAIQVHADCARAHGAELREGVRVLGWTADEHGVRVETSDGVVHGDHLVLTAGVWSQALAQVGALKIRPSRQVLGWIRSPASAPVDRDVLGVWALELDDSSVLYGFPRMEGLPGPAGFKVARHWAAETCDPDDLDRSSRSNDADDFLPYVDRFLPDASGSVVDVQICLYGNTEDGHFRVGVHPEADRVVVAAGFSGHGLKFQPVIGEILADLTLGGQTSHETAFLSLNRSVG